MKGQHGKDRHSVHVMVFDQQWISLSSLLSPFTSEAWENTNWLLSNTRFQSNALHILKHCVAKTGEEQGSVNNLPLCLAEIKNIFHGGKKCLLLLGVPRDWDKSTTFNRKIKLAVTTFSPSEVGVGSHSKESVEVSITLYRNLLILIYSQAWFKVMISHGNSYLI